jgi:hypothetical protein
LCRKGQTFLVPSGPDLHLFFAITEEDNDGMQILVNVSSIDPDISHDPTCTLSKGDHEFIKDPSYITYGRAIERHKNFIEQQVQKGVYKEKEDTSVEVIEKIRSGVKKSPFSKRAIKDAYDRCVRAEEKRKKNSG